MRKPRTALKFTLPCAFVVLFTAVWNLPAHAYTWSRNVIVHNANGICVQVSSGIDHRRPGVFSGNLAYANVYARTQGCGAGLTLTNPRAAAVRLDVMRFDGSAWTVCRRTDWQFGPTGVTGGDTGGPYGPAQVFDYGGAVCGPGLYGTMTFGAVHYGGEWRGGRGVWSGSERLP